MLAKMSDFAPVEQELIWKIKQAITDPSKTKNKQGEYQEKIKERRQLLSMAFEDPQPIVDNTPVVEADASEYTG